MDVCSKCSYEGRTRCDCRIDVHKDYIGPRVRAIGATRGATDIEVRVGKLEQENEDLKAQIRVLTMLVNYLKPSEKESS